MTEQDIFHWDQDETKAWFKAHAAPGMVVAVHHGYGEFRWFELDRIISVNQPTKGRVYLQRHGAFYFSGKNCYHPTGQVWLPIPTGERLAVASQPVHWHYDKRHEGWGPGNRAPLPPS